MSPENGIPRVMDEARRPSMPLDLTPPTWQRIKTLVADALERPAEEREAFVTAACGPDEALAREVLSIVRAAALADAYLEGPIGLSTASTASGARIGPWRVVRPLGHGGMASVYLAERADAEFTQRAALKLVRGGFVDDVLRRRFDDERRILASLEHPHIARFIDGGATADGVPYVTLEYVEGVRIDEFCESSQLVLRETLALFRQVCSAVEYAHQRLIVHRDIKASNILISADGTPKLLDFGIAKLIDPAAMQQQTRTLLRVATPASASPEQLRGEPVTTATDIYSLGVLLYRLVTGVSPYRGPLTSDVDLLRAVCEETPIAPSRLIAGPTSAAPAARWLRWGRSDDLDHILLKALRKEPERRYLSVEQFSSDLQRYLEARPVAAAPDSRAYRTRKFLARHRAGAVAAAVLVFAVAAGVSATAWQARIASRERARAQAQFDAVRSLANAVLGDVFDAITPLPGSVPAQRLVLAKATAYLDSLVPQAADDVALRVELATGYMRLAQVLGLPGMPNLGDKAGAQQSYEKAVALLEPLVARSSEPSVRFRLADAYARLASLSSDREAKVARLRAGLALVENQPADARQNGVVQDLWALLSETHIFANRLEEATRASHEAVTAAERAYALAPEDLHISRNLSLALKSNGALLEYRGVPDAALVEYGKARELDLARVRRDPGRSLWKLDLSFAYGSIGTARAKKGELQEAIATYREAVALREQAAKAEPDDDFIALSLARGHRRMAEFQSRVPDIEGVFTSLESQLAVLRRRLDAHPDRPNLWQDYGQAAFGAVRLAADVLQSHRGHPSSADRVRTMLADLRTRRAQWAATHPGFLAEDDAAFAALTARIRDLK
jgi:tetratricopeptide (TPR) repeat protein/tRNA A-37 threonylcarbamoyl transferase component Bud32